MSLIKVVKLRYDGKNVFDNCTDDLRQWTIMSDFFDVNGANRKGSSFMFSGLKELGVLQ